MEKNWIISDTHFGHQNIIKFTDKDGKLIRGQFKTVEEMDETMVDNWNAVVRDQDRVFHLGDVVMNRRCLPILNRLKGKKVLIKGNHDIFKLSDYTPYFEDIRAYKVYPNLAIIFSHIPVHPYQLKDRFIFNGHGHLHQNMIDDPRYINLCVENTNYKPVDLDELIETKLKKFYNKGSL